MDKLIQLLQQKRQQHVEAIQAIDQLMAVEQNGGASATGLAVAATARKNAASASMKIALPGKFTRTNALRLVLEQAKKPLSLSEIILGMKHLGFKFQSKDPKNSLNSVIYGKDRAPFIAKTDSGFVLKH